MHALYCTSYGTAIVDTLAAQKELRSCTVVWVYDTASSQRQPSTSNCNKKGNYCMCNTGYERIMWCIDCEAQMKKCGKCR